MAVTASRRNGVTMADIVAEERARPKVPDQRLNTPGRLNRDGDLCDPGGDILDEADSDLSEDDALFAVHAGASVAYESCGCGGGGRCAPQWFTGHDVRNVDLPPRRIRGKTPSWISLWQGLERQVVFVHGDYVWAGLF